MLLFSYYCNVDASSTSLSHTCAHRCLHIPTPEQSAVCVRRTVPLQAQYLQRPVYDGKAITTQKSINRFRSSSVESSICPHCPPRTPHNPATSHSPPAPSQPVPSAKHSESCTKTSEDRNTINPTLRNKCFCGAVQSTCRSLHLTLSVASSPSVTRFGSFDGSSLLQRDRRRLCTVAPLKWNTKARVLIPHEPPPRSMASRNAPSWPKITFAGSKNCPSACAYLQQQSYHEHEHGLHKQRPRDIPQRRAIQRQKVSKKRVRQRNYGRNWRRARG